MALIPYPTPDEMTPEVRHDIETFAKEHGRPTLVRMMLAWFPTALHAMENMYHPIMTEGLLPRRLKELLFVAASNERGCFYWQGGHSRFLVQEFGYTQEDVENMRVGEAAGPLSDAERELVKYVRKVVRDPRSIDGEDMATLHEAGWSNAQIVEALSMVCLSGFTNTLALAMRFEDDLVPMGFDGYF